MKKVLKFGAALTATLIAYLAVNHLLMFANNPSDGAFIGGLLGFVGVLAAYVYVIYKLFQRRKKHEEVAVTPARPAPRIR